MGEAVLIGGMDLCVVPEGQFFTVHHLGILAVDYSNLMRDLTDENMKHLYDEFEQAWSRSGLQGGSQGASPMAVLASSSFRSTEFELDRVYGVMQIFGDEFSVGKARTDLYAAAEQSFTLLELEDALGALVIQSYPAVSQLFYHESAPRAGGAWRICGAAAVPSQLSAAWGHFGYLDAFDSQCRLSIRVEGGTTWAWFEAKTCPLERMANCYRLLSSRYTEHPNCVRLNCWFDAGPQSPCSKEGRDGMRNIYRFEDIDPVVERFGRETLVLVILSTSWSKRIKLFTLYGLLLLRPGEAALKNHRSRRGWNPSLDAMGLKAWARVGMCRLSCRGYDISDYSQTRELDKGSLWHDRRGFLGLDVGGAYIKPIR